VKNLTQSLGCCFLSPASCMVSWERTFTTPKHPNAAETSSPHLANSNGRFTMATVLLHKIVLRTERSPLTSELCNQARHQCPLLAVDTCLLWGLWLSIFSIKIRILAVLSALQKCRNITVCITVRQTQNDAEHQAL